MHKILNPVVSPAENGRPPLMVLWAALGALVITTTACFELETPNETVSSPSTEQASSVATMPVGGYPKP